MQQVTVVCLSFNHERFIREAVESVVRQTYQNIQIIIVDNGSTDKSVAVIQQLKAEHPGIEVLLLEENIGNCKAFNRAFAMATGDFVVDFSTDDVMLPDRLGKQVTHINTFGEEVGIVFTDADYIDGNGVFIRSHFEYLRRKGLISEVPVGDVYRQVIEKYFIPSPTALIKREVLVLLGGYDESLSYEDFDLFVRASRVFRFEYLDEKLTAIRKLAGSMSTKTYLPGDQQLMSTYKVCLKAADLGRTPEDMMSLIRRVRYELRQSVLTQNHPEAILFFKLLDRIGGVRAADQTWMLANRFRIPLGGLRKAYHNLRFR